MNRKKEEKSSAGGFFSSQDYRNDKDFVEFEKLYNILKDKYNLTSVDLINEIEKEILIPISIFNKKLSGLELIVKYLKENLGLSFKKIADLINRSEKTIWQAYNSSKKKFPGKFLVKVSDYYFPVLILKDRKFGVLENIVLYLKENYNLSYSEIGRLLKRDERTIWTVYNRAKKK